MTRLRVTPKIRPIPVTDRMVHRDKPALRRLFAFPVLLILSACSQPSADRWESLGAEQKPGGLATLPHQAVPRFDLPPPVLGDEEKALFYAGRALAHQPWVKAPTTTTQRDGLGPLFNARSCLGCHISGGRGNMPANENEALFTAFVRIGLDGTDLQQGSVPEPVYGQQLQTQSTSLSSQLGVPPRDDELRAEASVHVRWHEQEFRYPDGSRASLRMPEILLSDFSDGPLHEDTRMSLRNAPAMFGIGLLAAVPLSELERLADPQDLDGNGISGRLNQVWNPRTGATEPGRFGLKANRPDLPVIVAAAFAHDIGITNRLFPQQPCTSAQIRCLSEPDGNDEEGTELSDNLLNLTVSFVRDTAVPAARLQQPHAGGRDQFYAASCQQCHQPSFRTVNVAGAPFLSEQTIWPYSDLLLHDMGDGLADGRSDFLATGSEWRTAPLWGIGLQKRVAGALSLLHDGRARSVEEAVLWHDGEARASRDHYIRLPLVQRRELEIFVEAL